jgi:Mor family transcriptional regulator
MAKTETTARSSVAPARREGLVTARVFDNPDLVDAIFKRLAEEVPELAVRLARVEADVRFEFQGIETYIARRSPARRQQRTKQVLELFNGRNAADVARALGIGRTTVYRIIAQAAVKE